MRVTLPPVQKVIGPLAEIVGVAGIAFTVTTVGAETADVQPAATTRSVTLWLEEMVSVVPVPPLLQRFPLALLEVKTTLPPVQKLVGPPGVMVGVAGTGFEVTTTVFETKEVQPNAMVWTVTF